MDIVSLIFFAIELYCSVKKKRYSVKFGYFVKLCNCWGLLHYVN